jgi:hypothetical protein
MLGGYDRYIYGQLFDMLADDMRQGRSPVEAYVFEQYKGEWGYNVAECSYRSVYCEQVYIYYLF